jgi:hypothetical protein
VIVIYFCILRTRICANYLHYELAGTDVLQVCANCLHCHTPLVQQVCVNYPLRVSSLDPLAPVQASLSPLSTHSDAPDAIRSAGWTTALRFRHFSLRAGRNLQTRTSRLLLR